MEDRIVKITVAGKVKEYEDGLNVTQLIEKENEMCIRDRSWSKADECSW